MQLWKIGFFSLSLVALPHFAGAADLAAQSVKVFTGGEGVRVIVVRLKPLADKKALIQVSGTDTPSDDKIMLHDVDESGDRVDYRTKRDGSDYATLVGRSGGYSVYVPGKRDGVSVRFDEKVSQATKADDVLSRYLHLRSGGPLDKVDRAKVLAENEQALKKQVDAVNGACGSKLSASFDGTIKDEHLKELDVAGACGEVLSAIESLCDDDVGKDTVKTKIQKVVCSMGSNLSVKGPASGTITFTTAKGASNAEEFAKAILLKSL